MSMKTAIVFPGQGSQKIGMLAELASEYSIVQEIFEEASDVLGYDLWALAQSGPVETLNQTEYTQPALLTAGYAAWRLWQQQGLNESPSFLAGHSLGEYTALLCAEAITFTEAVQLVQKRGQLMQRAVAPGLGAMAAILALSQEDVQSLCDTVTTGAAHQVQIANLNAPGQIVVAGHRGAVEQLVAAAKQKGAKRALVLPVSVPAHCTLIEPIAQEFQGVLQSMTWSVPQLPVIHNVDLTQSITVEALIEKLTQQLFSPVRWVETLQWLSGQGINCFIECGPGKVLMGLNKRIVPTGEHYGIYDVASLQQCLQTQVQSA